MTTYSNVADPAGVPQRIVSSAEARERPWVPTRPELLETVATESERTCAAVIEALRQSARLCALPAVEGWLNTRADAAEAELRRLKEEQ